MLVEESVYEPIIIRGTTGRGGASDLGDCGTGRIGGGFQLRKEASDWRGSAAVSVIHMLQESTRKVVLGESEATLEWHSK